MAFLFMYGGYSLYEHMYPANQIALQDFTYGYLTKNRVSRLELEKKRKENVVHVYLDNGEKKEMVLKELEPLFEILEAQEFQIEYSFV